MSSRSSSWLVLAVTVLLGLLLLSGVTYTTPSAMPGRVVPLTASVTETATPTPILISLPLLARAGALPALPFHVNLDVTPESWNRYTLKWSCCESVTPIFDLYEEKQTEPWQQAIIYSGPGTSYSTELAEGSYAFRVEARNPGLIGLSDAVRITVVQPTATPTPTPPLSACAPLTCSVPSDTTFTWDITCEHGPYTENYTTADNRTWTGSRTYSESGNVYNIDAYISAGCGHYGCRRDLYLTVTGGQLGADSLSCHAN